MEIDNRPLIGIILDEDTSNGGRFYNTNKGYFRAIYEAGGAPIALPYEKSSISFAKQYCKAIMSTGARIRFPDSFYISGEQSDSPLSDRYEFEAALIEYFVNNDLPYLGICNGMQILAGLHGAKLTFQLKEHQKGDINHNNAQTVHSVEIIDDNKLSQLVGKGEFLVNSYHNEAVVSVSDNILVNAIAEDGTIEGIEIKNKKFAIGVQWHPELLWNNPQLQNAEQFSTLSEKLFKSFVNMAK